MANKSLRRKRRAIRKEQLSSPKPPSMEEVLAAEISGKQFIKMSRLAKVMNFSSDTINEYFASMFVKHKPFDLNHKVPIGKVTRLMDYIKTGEFAPWGNEHPPKEKNVATPRNTRNDHERKPRMKGGPYGIVDSANITERDLDGSRGYSVYRDQGKFGSHPSHDDYGEDGNF